MNSLPDNLKKDINKIISQNPESEKVFNSLIEYFEKLSVQNEKDSKRKKIEDTSNNGFKLDGNIVNNLEGSNIMLQLPELSIQSPFRKRLNLVFGAFKGEKKAFLALTKSLESKPELLLKSLTIENIKFAAILNVPEKKPLRYFLIDYINNDGNVYKNDPILIQFNNDQLEEQFGSILGGKNFVEYLTSQLKLVDFNVLDCTSNTKIFSVQAYKGSKEGFLYFLPNHVIFGFKKPIYIFNSTDIESITYNSITRLTFNILLNVKIHGLVEVFEFSMIDQKEFENIDEYVKTKDVRDISMAEQFKAQKQLKNNTDTPSDLAEAAKLVPGGDQLLPNDNDEEDDDDEEDDNYEIGDSDDDHSDISDRGENNEYNESDNNNNNNKQKENFTQGSSNDSLKSLDTFKSFDNNLQNELMDLQQDLDIDISEFQKEGYMDI